MKTNTPSSKLLKPLSTILLLLSFLTLKTEIGILDITHVENGSCDGEILAIIDGIAGPFIVQLYLIGEDDPTILALLK